MKRTMKWIGNVFIIIGLATFIFLGLGMKNVEENQNELIKAFETVKTEANSEMAVPEKVPSERIRGGKEITNDMEGILTIPSIDLRSPVLRGATSDNLNVALGAINGLDEPGEVNGSYAIAGHQSHIFGKFFNRLNELEEGDRFTFDTMDETMQFEVFEIQVVKPEEVSVLDQRKGIAMVSLITCYPENSNKFRLIVQAKRVTEN